MMLVATEELDWGYGILPRFCLIWVWATVGYDIQYSFSVARLNSVLILCSYSVKTVPLWTTTVIYLNNSLSSLDTVCTATGVHLGTSPSKMGKPTIRLLPCLVRLTMWQPYSGIWTYS